MKRFRLLPSLALVCVLPLCISHRAAAQALGTISGTVLDASGAAIPSAIVTLTDEKTGVSAKTQTQSTGLYVFPSVNPSDYKLSIAASGFKQYQQSNISLEANQSVTIDAKLSVGAATETVSVEANPVQVNTTSGTLSQVVEQREVNAMPLNGRNAATLTTLVAGVVVAPNAQTDQGVTKTFPTDVTISANGARVGETSFMLDGGNNVDEYTNVNAPFPFPDALQEFSVQTSNYTAEYGENAGGIVNIVTKSGGDQFHGDLFEFVRNRYFNAANYFSYVNGVKTVDPQKRNQYGLTIGGPVEIPHLFHPGKSFFFFGWQSEVFHTNATSSSAAVLPTTGQLAGTFTGDKSCVVNPLQPTHVYPCTATGSTYTTTVNTGDYNAAALALLKHLPSGGATGIYTYQVPTQVNYLEFPVRYDEQIGDHDTLTVRYYYDRFQEAGVNNNANLLTYTDQAAIGYTNALIAETHTFGTHIVNNFILSDQHEDSVRGPLAGGIDVADLGVNIWQPAFKQINEIEVGSSSNASAYFNIGGNPQAQFLRNNYTLRDDFHDQVGNHSLSFGMTAEISKVDINNLYEEPGQFAFNSNNTNDPIASFLFGYLYSFTQASGQYLNLRGHFEGYYAQDSWKLTHTFTLNYGLRYEPFYPWREMQGRMGSFSPTNYVAGIHSTEYPNAPIGMVYAGDPGFNPNGIANNYTHFMPRVGFAWDVLGTGKVSLRGGAGTFYDSRMNAALYNAFTGASPFIETVSINNLQGQNMTFNDPYGSYGITDPFPTTQPPPHTLVFPPQSYFTWDPIRGFRDPVFYQWDLGVEYQMTKSLLTRVAYAASHGSHLWESLQLNPTWNTGANKGQRIYTPTYATEAIGETNTGANSHYNGLQLSAEQRASRGLTILANYTWSKSLDNEPYNASETSGGGGPNYVMPLYVPHYWALDYGPSDFDHRSVSSISYVYSLPQVAHPNGLVRYAVNGWQTSGIFAFHTGDPLTVVSGSSNNSGTAQGSDRSVMTGNPYGGSACPAGSHCKSYLNPASFSNNTAGTYGTYVKGSLVGPHYVDWDVAAVKGFNFSEHADLQFRAEYFNLLNHTNFGDPGTTVNSTLGQITGTNGGGGNSNNTAGDPRIAQFSLKLVF